MVYLAGGIKKAEREVERGWVRIERGLESGPWKVLRIEGGWR